jgi:hypothetical protein
LRHVGAATLLLASGVAVLVLVPGGAFGQTIRLIPECGVAGATAVCVAGAGWPEPELPCHYDFFLDSEKVAPDQPDGLQGPPATSFTIPAATSEGEHPVRVDLRLNQGGRIVAGPVTKTLKVVTSEATSSISHSVMPSEAGSSEGIRVNFKCDCAATCDQITFIQTVQRLAIVNGEETFTSLADYPATCYPNRAPRAALETDPMRVRVDQWWSLSAPYYNVGDSGALPAIGEKTRHGQLGDCTGSQTAELVDRPDTPVTCFPTLEGGFATKVILRFEVAPFCVAGADAGKFLGQVLNWEQHQFPGETGTVPVVSSRAGQPTAEFLEALDLWVDAKYPGKLPKPMAAACE